MSQESVPNPILDQAFDWAVVLGSGVSTDADRQAFRLWLAEAPSHRAAWDCVQLLEQDFATVREVGKPVRSVLDSAADGVKPKRTKVSGLKALMSALLVLSLAGGALLDRPHWSADYVTAVGETRRIELAGGAVVHLNGRTALDIESVEGGILLLLHDGEILLETASAAAADKPRVVTGEARLVPLGTRFLVERREPITRLTVIQGQVTLQPVLGSAQKALAGSAWQATAHEAEPMAATGLLAGAWVDGVVEADNARLGDLLEVFSDHWRGWLRYDDSAAALRVSGVFHLSDAESALKALQQTLPIDVARKTPWWVSIKGNRKH